MPKKDKILIIQSVFYPEISSMLLDGAVERIKQENLDCEIVNVPGAFEVPAAIAFAHESEKYSGYVTLGCVIRGETTHYDYVCQESARGINHLAMKKKIAVGYGILTVENEEQALERADPTKYNKGGAVAHACIEMMKLKKHFLG